MEPSQESNKMIIVDYFSGETSQPKLSPQETKDRGLTDSPTEILPNLPSKIKIVYKDNNVEIFNELKYE